MSNTIRVKEKYGLVQSLFYPIASEPSGKHPVYGPKVDLGSAVKDYLTINYSEAKAYGDDVTQLALREFVDGQLQIETLLSDLEVDAALYGSRMEGGVLYDHVDDSPNSGAHACIQKLKTKAGIVFRAVFYFYVTPSQNADNSDTKGSSVTFMNNSITANVMADATGHWRARADKGSQAEALAFIEGLVSAVNGGAHVVTTDYFGGAEDGKSDTIFVEKDGSGQVVFTTPPTILYDNAKDVTAQLADNVYTLNNVNTDHRLVAIYSAA